MPKIPSDFVNNLYKTVETNLKTSKNKTLIDYILKYTDKNNDVLLDIGPNKRLFFTEQDKSIIFFCSGLKPEAISKIIKESTFIENNWVILSNPINIAATLLIRYYTITKKKKELELMILYFTYYFYASIHFKYFKYEPQPNIMAYTINDLSNKFLIKQYGNLLNTLKATSMKCHETNEKKLIEGNDLDIKDYIVAFRSRLDNLILNIAKNYYDNFEKGNYLNTEIDDYSEENYHINDNTSFQIKALVDKTVFTLSSKPVDSSLASTAANICGVSVNVTKNALMNIREHNSSEVRVLINLILELYLSDPKNTVEKIGSNHYIDYCLELYIKSNTSDKAIIKIKNLLDSWLTANSEKYRKTERKATLNNFRKAIYLYYVLVIQQAYLH